MLYDNLGINEKGHLTIGGADTTELAAKYKTALYVIDEDKLRSNMRTYVNAMSKYLPAGSMPLYASKALSFKAIYPICNSEGMAADTVSPGEIFTAVRAGFPPEKIYFHGDNKTDDDIEFALDNGVGCFIVDNPDELTRLDRIAGKKGVTQDVILRITLGIDPHTQKAINTGRIDCQFGVPVDTGQAEPFVKKALELKNINLLGFHSHIGSEIFEPDPFLDQVDLLMEFALVIRDKYDFTAKCFNLGGGFAVRYKESDPEVDIEGNIEAISKHLETKCGEHDYPAPAILLEPGRSIVANAGLTLYTAGGIKEIKGYRTYITVDGGMTDNPRYALYESPYTIHIANRMSEENGGVYTISGRCCESGDLIQENVELPECKPGDIIAVLGTGAYNFSMASNYNRLVRPGVIMVKGGNARPVVRRQTFDDLISCDL